jgi:hypothetical protein
MQNKHDPDLPVVSTPAAKRALINTILLASAVFLIPVLIGLLFVMVSHRLSPRPVAPDADSYAQLTNQLHDGSVTQVPQLASLRREFREAGVATDDVDIRLWAARVQEPETLFSVPPPAPDKRWNWHLSQDGLFALAVSMQIDHLDRRDVGLFDLVREEWVWTNTLPWPDTHETPHVFGRRLILRYVKNAAFFALEIDPNGTIVSIDRLRSKTFQIPSPMPAFPNIAGQPVGIRHGVCFVTDLHTGTLSGYAPTLVPGLHDVGPYQTGTVLSGNGLLLFRAAEGCVTVSDTLTGTLLQTFNAWPHTTNTAVTGALATGDGSGLTVFLQTEFDGTPPIRREWSVAIDVYAGTVKRSFSADALFAKPTATETRSAMTSDSRWVLAVDTANVLTVSPARAPDRPSVSIPLGELGVRDAIRHIAFLEQGRYLLMRSDTHLWLLDFKQARAYGGLTARIATSSRTIPLEAYQVSPMRSEPNAMLALSEMGYGEQMPFDPDDLAHSFDANATAPSYLAMRAEFCIANQAWGYAVGMLEETARLQEYDMRAPRINPLLAARCQIMAGRPREARTICRETLQVLIRRPDTTPRMILYHLQGLLFAPVE